MLNTVLGNVRVPVRNRADKRCVQGLTHVITEAVPHDLQEVEPQVSQQHHSSLRLRSQQSRF